MIFFNMAEARDRLAVKQAPGSSLTKPRIPDSHTSLQQAPGGLAEYDSQGQDAAKAPADSYRSPATSNILDPIFNTDL